MPKLKRLTKKQVVEVAKDVLKLMRALDVRDHCNYLTHAWNYNAHKFDGKKLLQSKIPLISKDCTVCAQGAVVLGHIHLYDGVSALPANEEVNDMARMLFAQADLIEDVFESPDYFAGRWSDLDPKPRLRAMMRNIIKNNGILKVKKLEEYA